MWGEGERRRDADKEIEVAGEESGIINDKHKS